METCILMCLYDHVSCFPQFSPVLCSAPLYLVLDLPDCSYDSLLLPTLFFFSFFLNSTFFRTCSTFLPVSPLDFLDVITFCGSREPFF